MKILIKLRTLLETRIASTVLSPTFVHGAIIVIDTMVNRF